MKCSFCFFAVLAMAVCAFPAQQSGVHNEKPQSVAAQKSGSGAARKSSSGKKHKSRSAAAQKPVACPTISETPEGPELKSLFSQMDAAAGAFHRAEADLTQEDYQKVVADLTIETGKIYFRRTKKGLQVAMDFLSSPDSKYVLLADDKISFYQPKIDQVTEHPLGKNSSETESMFALGFGGSSHDLLKSFDVKVAGSAVMDGVKTSKLELTPKTEGLKKYFSLIELWVDPARDISLRQKFWQPSGDYHLACYSNIKMNKRISGRVFKLKTTRRTKTVTP